MHPSPQDPLCALLVDALERWWSGVHREEAKEPFTNAPAPEGLLSSSIYPCVSDQALLKHLSSLGLPIATCRGSAVDTPFPQLRDAGKELALFIPQLSPIEWAALGASSDSSESQIGRSIVLSLFADGVLQTVVSLTIPTGRITLASAGLGTWTKRSRLGASFERLTPAPPISFHESALLFSPSGSEELRLVEFLKRNDLVENTYCFGDFASDCIRLASGHEQFLITLAAEKWQTPAVLFAQEAGLSVILDPVGAPRSLERWKPEEGSSVLIAPPRWMPDLQTHLVTSRSLANVERKTAP